MKGTIPETLEEVKLAILAKNGPAEQRTWLWDVKEEERTQEAADMERAKYFLAFTEADNLLANADTKDIAESILHGLGPVDEAWAAEWLTTFIESYENQQEAEAGWAQCMESV